MFDTFNLAFTTKGTLSYIMKIKSRFISKRVVLLDLKISNFGWKRGIFLIQNSEKGLFSKLVYEELLNIMTESTRGQWVNLNVGINTLCAELLEG